MRTLTVIIASALALTACGGNGAAGDDPSASREQMRDAALAFARCMREHGIDMPDPKTGGGIQLALPKGTTPAEAQAADKACRKYLDKVKPPEMSEAQQKQFRDAALANARCMREHGIDMPDPTFGADGTATIRIGSGKGRTGLDPNNPRFQAAQKACAKYMPKIDGGATTQEPSP